MKNSLVSVIIPIYKVENYLDRCVESIVNQTYRNLDIILVDDGSPDNCPNMCEDWAKKDSRIRVIHKKNGGLMAAWIDGLKIAKGEYIAFVDSDDWAELNFVEELVTPFLNDETVDLVACNYYDAYDNFRVLVEIQNCNEEKDFIEGEELQAIKNQVSDFDYSRWNKMFKKDMLLNNLKYCNTSISIGEDISITRACFLDSNKVYYVKKPIYNYYFRTTSLVNTFKANSIQDFERVNVQLLKMFKEKNYDIEQNMAGELQHQIFFALKSIFWGNTKEKRTNYKLVLNSNLIKDYLNCDEKYFSKTHRYMKKIIKSKSYLLMKLYFSLLKKRYSKEKEKIPY